MIKLNEYEIEVKVKITVEAIDEDDATSYVEERLNEFADEFNDLDFDEKSEPEPIITDSVVLETNEAKHTARIKRFSDGEEVRKEVI
jgi:hypothetical protein